MNKLLLRILPGIRSRALNRTTVAPCHRSCNRARGRRLSTYPRTPRSAQPQRAPLAPRPTRNMATNAPAAAVPNGVAEKGDETEPQNAWSHPGPAEFDFRTDVVTTPTPTMLAAIQHTTLLDAVFLSDPTTNALETHLASLTHQESALFTPSGTMANQLALRAHLTQPPHAILCDSRAHILRYEAGGAASLSGALVYGITPQNGRYLTLEDVVAGCATHGAQPWETDVHACPVRVVALETPCNGLVAPLSEVRRVGAWCRERGIKCHVDGARLWEAVAAGAGALGGFCEAVDSVSLCFSKGLGAPVGSVLVGARGFVGRARWVMKGLGGGMRQVGVLTAAARVAVEETFGAGENGEGGKLRGAQERARVVGANWTKWGGELEVPVETNMVWVDLEDAGVTLEEFIRVAAEEGVKVFGKRLVVHYQISEEAVRRLDRVFARVLEKKRKRGGDAAIADADPENLAEKKGIYGV